MIKKQKHFIEINFQGFNLEVNGVYTPCEPEVRFPVDNAYPGTSHKFDVESIFCDGKELYKTLPDGEEIQLDILEEKILEKEFE